MFQDQNKNISNHEIEDIPVHTMQQDLAEAKNPELKKINNPDIETAVQRKPINLDNLNAAQKSSPFLSPTPEIIRPEPEKNAPVQMDSAPINKPLPATEAPAKETIAKTPSTGGGKAFLVIATSLAIILIVGGGYYFWMMRPRETAKIVEEAPQAETIPEPIPEPITPPVPSFSTDKPNYLNISSDLTANGNEVKAALQDYASKISDPALKTVTEFVVTDAKNNPILFSDFVKNFGITLSPGVTKNLAETFSVFMYNDQGAVQLGLAIDAKNEALLKSALTKEEKSLVANILPLYLDATFTKPAATAPFDNTIHNGAEIRYLNFTAPQPTALDYAIFNKQLLIGTSKLAMFSIIDYITDSITQTPATPTPPVTQ